MFLEELPWENDGELDNEGRYKKRHTCTGMGRGRGGWRRARSDKSAGSIKINNKCRTTIL
jgi:hypothetical protein